MVTRSIVIIYFSGILTYDFIMYVEISKENEKPQTYKIGKPETIIGSGLSCDIRVEEHSVSKKHIKIIQENEQWFVVDQGSTNGTYKDGERLIPGKRNDIHAGEYLRLAGMVFVCLVETPGTAPIQNRPKAIEIHEPREEDKTRVMTLDEIKKSAETKKKVTPEKKKKVKKKKPQTSTIIALVILVGGYVLNKSCTKPEEDAGTIISTLKNNIDSNEKKADAVSE